MSRASVLARGRAAAEAGMQDACLVEEIVGTSTDRDTGQVTEDVETVYEGPFRLQEHGGYPRDINTAPDQPQLAVSREAQFPVATSGAIRAGHRLTVTACVNDAAMVGRVMWLRGQPTKSEATSRRFNLEEIAS